MKILYIITLALGISACSSIKQSSREWNIVYPNPKDSTIIQIKGLYTNKGKLLYNNATESNVDKKEFEDNYLFKLTEEQIIALEKFVIQYELINDPLYENDVLKVLKKHKRYARLYTGYICTSRDSIFILSFIEKPGNIEKYHSIPVMLAEPWVKVPEIKTFFIDLNKNIRTNVGDYYNPCTPIKVQ